MSVEKRLSEVTTELQNLGKSVTEVSTNVENVTASLQEARADAKKDHDDLVALKNEMQNIRAVRERTWQVWLAVISTALSFVAMAIAVVAKFSK